MTDRTAATVGFVFAGVALAASVGAWSGRFGLVAAALGAVATVALAARRHGYLEPGAADGVAVVGGIGAALTAVVSLVAQAGGGGSPPVGSGIVVTAVAGIGAAALAYADWRGVPRSALISKFSSGVTASALGLAGLLALLLWGLVLSTGYSSIVGSPQTSTEIVLTTMALGLGTATVAWLYLEATGRGFAFVDLRRPTGRDAAVVVGGTLGLLGVNLGIGWVFRQLGLPAARHTIFDIAQDDPGLLLLLIPLSYLFVGPGEELLYRNVVQKSLYETFSRPAAIVVASTIFALVHVPAYSSAGATPLSILNTLTVVFALALVLGVAFVWTRNVLVTALIHASFNAIAFAVTYTQLVG